MWRPLLKQGNAVSNNLENACQILDSCFFISLKFILEFRVPWFSLVVPLPNLTSGLLGSWWFFFLQVFSYVLMKGISDASMPGKAMEKSMYMPLILPLVTRENLASACLSGVVAGRR